MIDNEHSSREEKMPKSKDDPIWEREVLEKLAMAAVTEQRRTRRWGIFFKVLMFAYLIGVGFMAFYPTFKNKIDTGEGEYTAVVDVIGVIAENEAANAGTIIEGLRDAVEDKNSKGVILNINSPGGSPVQSAYVYDEIKRLKQSHPDLPIYAVVSDICASGGYYIASAADKIYVNQASMIGSIGVIMNGFGFVNVMEKMGVDRRLLIAGEHKALMDPFSPVKKDEIDHMQTLLNSVHDQFITAVREGRGEKLNETEDMFSGLIWTGAQGVKLGLADDFGSVDSVARDVIGVKKTRNFTPQEQLLEKITGKLGASMSKAITSAFTQPVLR